MIFADSLSMISYFSNCSKSSIITIGMNNSRITELFTTSTEVWLLCSFVKIILFLQEIQNHELQDEEENSFPYYKYE